MVALATALVNRAFLVLGGPTNKHLFGILGF